MKLKKSLWTRLVIVGLMTALAVFPLIGCTGEKGDDGSRGAAGPAGPEGPKGDPGVALEDVVPLNLILDLTQTASYNSSTGKLSIHFFLTDEDENGVNVMEDAYELRFYVSELIPASDPPALVDPGPAWHQLIAEQGTPAAFSPLPGMLTLVDSETGEYTYVFDDTLDTNTNVIRVTVRARWRETINGERIVFANPVNASYDFLQSSPGIPLASSGADMVTTAACETCHGARIGNVGHGGGYTQVETCNHCHNYEYQNADPDRGGDEADLAFMIHRIHDAGVFDKLGDFSELTYPQHIYTCAKCHTGPQGNLAYTNPTRKNCGSCHAAVDFETGAGHNEGGVQLDDSGCRFCHPPTGIVTTVIHPVQTVHDVEPEPENVSEFLVTIILNAPSANYVWEAGETPIVTVTLVDALTNTPVAGSLYTTAQDAEGNAGGGLADANLYVYGPRSDAVPVLTSNSTTDDPPGSQQAHPLFVPSADSQVITDTDGFKYQMLPIPEDLAPGTYMVRFEGGDYGAISDEDYVTASSGLINFQIGTEEIEPKVSGDACLDCHGDTIMHLEGAHPHHVPFNTDHCLGCHDLSGNYAEYIGNRAHAIHSASATGDLHGSSRIWTEVTFPRPANNCLTCHTNLDADTPVWRIPWMPACGGCHGVDPDADPDDPEFNGIDPQLIIDEAAAAQHMIQHGGVPDASEPGTLACLVCHGEGRIADTFETHELIRFRPLPVDPNE